LRPAQEEVGTRVEKDRLVRPDVDAMTWPFGTPEPE